MKRTNFTRLLSGFLALVMVLMLVPVTPIRASAADDGTTLYLKPSNSWKADGARFAVYYFGGSETTGWADMTDADGDGLYEAVIPGGYTTVIFCRMNPAIAENTWDARWNQTSDLALPTDGSNCYTTAEDQWDGKIGTWSVHTPAVTPDPTGDATPPTDTPPVPSETQSEVTEPEVTETEATEPEEEKLPANVHVLDATKDMTAFAQGAKADGDSESFHDYFTVMYSAKNKVDGSNKTFDDGYTATQRLNFGGKTDPEKGMINSVKFVTAQPATVKIWWVSGGDGRTMAVYSGAGTVLSATTAADSVKNALYVSELRIEAAGTYYLGVPEGSNYLFKVQVTEDLPPQPKEFVLDTTADMTAFAQGAKADGDTEVFHDYFTVMYSAKNKVDGSNKTFDDGYTASQRLNFGGKTDPANGMINSVKFTTSGPADVKVWWVSGGDGRNFGIYSSAGTLLSETTDASVKNALFISTLSVPGAGTYYLGVPQGSNYLFKVQVTETAGGTVKPPRADWSAVAAPVFGAITAEGGEVSVAVTASVGYDGGDEVIVTMYDAEGNEIASKRSIAEKDEHVLTFEPTASGSYTFQAKLSRQDCEDKLSAEAGTVSFVLPLKAPVISSATSTGGGKVSVVWSAVPEAERYEVFCDGTLAGTTEELSYEVTGLTVGTEYAFTVTAVRGEAASDPSAAVTVTTTADAQRVWGFTRYGSSTNDSNNGYVGDLNADGAVTVYSEKGKGKIVPNSTDGVAFYYTAIPAEYNFTLRATVTVDSWTLSNGQEGFGLMAADRLGPNGSSAAFWNNQYMAIASKVEYTTDSGKYSMKLGLGAMAKTGLTPANLPTGAEMPAGFSSVTTTLDHTPEALGNGAGTYNIIGNATAAVPGTIAEKTTFVLELQKNNTGYFVTYYDAAGNVITRVKDYDPGALTRLDADNVYAGFFASRNARATFSDVTLTTILASEDAPGEERPVTKIEPTIAITSATTANSESYTAYLYSNVAGTAVLKKDGEIVAENIAITGGVRQEVPVTLAQGENKLEVTFTPDPDQDLGEFTELTSADPISASLTVSYQAAWADQNNLYIAPNGTPDGKGTKASPLDIYTAIRNVQPGQTIVMMEGTYLLDAPVKIEQGIDGTAEKPIRMIADPEAASRPVIDFQKKVTGITHGGDYWYFQGFDVTNSANGQKGFQVSGHYNTLDGINAYKNGNTGIQISRYSSSDPKSEWPSNNLILNCTSHNNSDAGYEDADGFAAKLTCGEGNVFDGCVAYNNADDGWDLYAKVETGPIGAVTIRNCVAYGNGYLEDGTNAGNGNGFKMGGESLSGKHKLINSYAFFNKAKGIDSNSCPDIIVENATSYNNESYNVAFYTNNAANTDFSATGIVSFKDASIKSGLSTGENLKPKGTQDTAKYLGDTNYYWDGTASKNAAGTEITADSFVSLEFKGVSRNADGTIDLQGFLELKDSTGSGAAPGGTGSDKPEIDPDEETGITTFAALKAAVEAAQGETTIVVDGDIDFAGTITVPAGAAVTITDDATARSLNRTTADALFDVPAGAVLKLQGTAAGMLTLDGKGVSAAVAMVTSANELHLDCVNLKNGKNSAAGGAVYISAGKLTAQNCVFEGNSAKTGGAIDTKTKTKLVLTITDSIFTNNTATNNGGAINLLDTNTLTLTGSTFTGNTVTKAAANKGGGALYIANTSATITGSTFKNNTVTGTDTSVGGAICYYALGAGKNTCSLTGSIFEGNSAPYGGGIALSDSGSARKSAAQLLWEDNTFKDNTATVNGGGIAVTYDCETMKCTVTMNRSTYSGNTAPEGAEADLYYILPGTGITVDGVALDTPPEEKPEESLEIKDMATLKETIEGAEAGSNLNITLIADIELDSTITVPTNVTVLLKDDGSSRTLIRTTTGAMFNVPAGASLTLSGAGGSETRAAGTKLTLDGKNLDATAAMITSAGELILTDVVMKNGKNSGTGGAVYLTAGTMTAAGSDFENNSAKTGGAIDTQTKKQIVLTVTDCTFTGNTVTGNGGAINLMDQNTMTLTGSAFTGNTVTKAAANKGGGALYIANTSAKIDGCSFENNTVTGTDTSVGGAICYYALGASKTDNALKNSTFNGNSAPYGGGIALSDSGKARNGLAYLLWEDNTFEGNTASVNGGGIAITYDCETMSFQVTMNRIAYKDNTAPEGAEPDFYYIGTGKGICVDGVYLDPTEAETYDFSAYTRVGFVPDVQLSEDILAQSLAGMALVDNYAYSVKLKGNPKPSGDTTNYHLNEPSTIFRTNILTGETVRLTPTDGNGYVPYMHHANGVGGVKIDGETYLFVATLVSGKQAVVKIRVSGTTFEKVGEYEVLENGASVSKSGIDILSVDEEKTVLLLKTGAWFYTAEVPHTQVDGTIVADKKFTVDMSAVSIGGSVENASETNGYTFQDCGYACGVLYVPVTTKDYTVVGVFEIFNEDGTMKDGLISPVPGKSLRLGGGDCRAVEVESLAVGSNGALYFNANCYALDGEINYDGVFCTANPVAPHNFQWTQLTAPTIETEGQEQLVCVICGEEGETRPIPKLEPIDYPFTQGGGQTVTQGESAAFKTGADFGKYEKVIINGKLLMNANITGSASGTTLTLSKTFTESLEPGTYTLEIHYEDGVAKTTFQVKAAPATDPTTRPTRPNTGGNAGTGDEFPMSALIVIMTLALIGIAVLVLSNRKFKK